MSISGGVIKPFKGQNYDELKHNHSATNLFEDPLFPANSSSLYFTQMPPQGIMWQRPKEARPNAEFVSAGYNRCDMDQGYLGNCWFIAGTVCIMQNPKLFAKVVPEDQSFKDGYAGIFHFRFWQYGEWVDVVIDDRLPFWPDGKLVFSSNREEPNEFWASLLEKAYAKLYGSYENLDAGQTYDAVVDMSGGIQEQFDLKSLSATEKSNFWNVIHKAFQKNSMMGCAINADPSVREARMANGLVRGHAYTITKVETIKGNNLIRNPWGNDVEWRGAWSDNSKEWDILTESEKKDIGLVKCADGEFWMCLNDFFQNWDNIQICHLTAESFSDELLETDNDSDLEFKCTFYQSAWELGKNAGGCGNGNPAKYWTNPQFLIHLTDVDKDDNENLATVMIALMQKDSRLKRQKEKSSDAKEEFIQFRLFKVKTDADAEQAKNSGMRLYANQLEKVGASGSYINSREVTKRFRVSPGYYLIIPSTYDENHNCEFMLRIFTESVIEGGSLDDKKDDPKPDEVVIGNDQEDVTFKYWISKLSPKLAKIVKIGKSVINIGKDGKVDLNVDKIKDFALNKDGTLNMSNIKGALNEAQDVFKDLNKGFGKFSSFFKK